ncbi:MAG TPA: SDR family NAD(P)-dependent oxidoreductase, partial [Solirubrobacteraceae bacterium]
MAELDGKRTLITGAAQGLGLAIAELFTERGARVAIADINGAAAEQAAASVGGDTIALTCDVTKAADVQAAIAATVEA